MFLEFIDVLKREIERELPGWEAQRRMISGRPEMDLVAIAKRNPRQSSVLILLYPSDKEIFTRLILRTEYKGVHSGQIAFPGGTKEEYDTDLWHTALREANEEVGVLVDKIQLVGPLSPVYIPPSNFWVQPYIGMSEDYLPVVIQKEEVQRSFDVNINMILDPLVKQEKIMIRSGTETGINTPYYNIEGYTVWGATAMMLSEFEELVRRVYKRMG
jgi:8-oxo-dGTP pyrophosphatase MutT (NUDIX family)